MIFCDMGINPNPFSAYDEIAWKLQENGIPASQIAVMGDADTDAKKQALFEKIRQGTVRVLLGSTAKMGTGTAVQKRLWPSTTSTPCGSPPKSSSVTAASCGMGTVTPRCRSSAK